jgi:hypothetical protein
MPGMTGLGEVIPWRVEFLAAIFLPASVLGPRLRCSVSAFWVFAIATAFLGTLPQFVLQNRPFSVYAP